MFIFTFYIHLPFVFYLAVICISIMFKCTAPLQKQEIREPKTKQKHKPQPQVQVQVQKQDSEAEADFSFRLYENKMQNLQILK